MAEQELASGSSGNSELELESPPAKKRKPSNLVKDIPSQISGWKKSQLDLVGLFYEKEPVKDLELLLNRTFSYDSKIPLLSKKLRPFVKVLEYFLDFNANEYQERVPKNIDKVTRFKEDVNNIKLSLAKTKAASFETVRHLFSMECAGDENFLRGMFEAIKWNCVYGFGEKMMYFMLESRKGTTNEMVYRQLYRDFFVTCGLNLMDGESKKKTIKIGKFHISSQPDLRCCIGEITELDMRTVIFVGEVKQRRVTLPTSDDFGIEHLHPYNIVGQHGGELLLEIQDSCFERTCEIDENDQSTLVFGAMCVGTQMIFTALEMSKKHIDAIKELEGEVLDDDECIGKSPIFFTRPYNLLKAADRSELYESLLRIACYQKKI